MLVTKRKPNFRIKPLALCVAVAGAVPMMAQAEILELIAKGYRNKEIAGSLGIGQETVQTHIKRLFLKLHVSDRTAAVTVALSRGIVHMP